MSKIISFFLASSITDIADDRRAVGDFINQINNIYQPLDIFIKLYKCEDESMDHSIIIGGTQKTLNELIQESDICFVIFWHKAGPITKQELEIAYEAFKKNNHPKVIVYFKSLDNDNVPEDIREVMKKIDEEMLHYHREYSHIDSLLLGIITQLQVHGFIREELKINSDKITLGGYPIISVEKLPVFSQNDKYHEKLLQFKEADDNCADLLRKYIANQRNKRIYREYEEQIIVRNRIKEDIDKMTHGMLDMTQYIAKLAIDSENTELIQKAIKFFDMGDYESVLDNISLDEIDRKIIEADLSEEKSLMDRRVVIEMFRLRIYSFEANGQWAEATEDYQRAMAQVEDRHGMPKSIMIEFAIFLFKQKQYQHSIAICEKLRSYGAEIDLGSFTQADLLDLMGELYFTTMRYNDAETVLKEALKYREFAIGDDFKQEVLKARTYVNLARVYFKVNRHFEAEELFLLALDIYRKNSEKQMQTIDADIADASLELGELYYMINRHADAAKLFLDARKIYMDLVNHGETIYMASVAYTNLKVAYLYIAIFSHKISDRYYIEALRVKQYLAQKDSIAYFEYLQQICEKLGNLWAENGDSENADLIKSEAERIKEGIQQNKYASLEKEVFHPLDESFYNKQLDKALVEKLCTEALNNYMQLFQENPSAFEPLLAQAYDTLGVFYTHTFNQRSAERNFTEAIKLRKILSERERSAMSTNLANSYSNLARLCDKYDQREKAEKYWLDAIEIYTSVSQKNAGAYDTDLARNYHMLANFYTKASDETKAEKFYVESILLYIKLFEKSPRAYVDRIINTIADITMFLDPLESAEWMKEFINF